MIPCKRPKVTVEPSPVSEGLYDHVCHVPGCGWTYRSVKSDHLGAPHHRRAHRSAVPTVTYAKGSYGFTVHWTCSCGKRDGASTRTDAEAKVAYHLSRDHGLVTC